MSHFTVALKQLIREYDITAREVAERSGIYESKMSRLMNERNKLRSQKDLYSIIEVFSTDASGKVQTPENAARLMAAWLMDAKQGAPGGNLIKIAVETSAGSKSGKSLVSMSSKAEQAMDYIRTAVAQDSEREKFIIQMAELMGAKFPIRR